MKVKSESEVAQSCLTLSDPMDCSLPGFSIHGIFQARVLEWGAIAFSRTYVYLWLIHVNVWQKPEQYYKAIILKLKLNKFKKIRYINVCVCVCVCVCVFMYLHANTEIEVWSIKWLLDSNISLLNYNLLFSQMQIHVSEKLTGKETVRVLQLCGFTT